MKKRYLAALLSCAALVAVPAYAEQQGAGQGTQSMSIAELSTDTIKDVQQRLNDRGYSAGGVDGVWGPSTKSAVRNFQQSQGMEATGDLNMQTLNALGVQPRSEKGRARMEDQGPMAAESPHMGSSPDMEYGQGASPMGGSQQ